MKKIKKLIKKLEKYTIKNGAIKNIFVCVVQRVDIVTQPDILEP